MATQAQPVHGWVAPGFEKVRRVFKHHFMSGAEVGAALSVVRDNEQVVHLWGGKARPDTPWQEETRCLVFSATKGLVALAFLRAEAQGKIDLQAPIARIWPAFGERGKEAVRVADVLNHRSGICSLERPLSLAEVDDPDALSDAVSKERLRWPTGLRQAYGATTYGLILGEVFRRAVGQSLGSYLNDEVFSPLGLGVQLGGAIDGQRLAKLVTPNLSTLVTKMLPRLVGSRKVEGRVYRKQVQPWTATAAAFRNPTDLGAKGLHRLSDPQLLRREFPWMGAVSDARALATIYGALACGGEADGVQLLPRSQIERVMPRISWAVDGVVQKPMGFSLGFLKEGEKMFSPVRSSFGHAGAGGSLGWADPSNRLGIGYVMNRMDYHVRSPRALALCHAIYRCVA